MIGFNFAQPFMITAVLVNTEDPIILESWNRGYGLIGATFLIYLGLAVWSWPSNFCFLYILRR